MLRIGMIGADNFHALAFSRLANLPPEEGGSGLPARVTMLWGESAQRAAFVANEAHIHTVVDDPARMLGQVDAVMVVLRHGAQHHDAALPFLRAGISTWVDKPFTTDIGQAAALVAAARESGALLAGGSTCKYCPARVSPESFLYANYAFTLRIAASTTCPTRTEVVTLPTPPGTGVIASTIGSTAA